MSIPKTLEKIQEQTGFEYAGCVRNSESERLISRYEPSSKDITTAQYLLAAVGCFSAIMPAGNNPSGVTEIHYRELDRYELRAIREIALKSGVKKIKNTGYDTVRNGWVDRFVGIAVVKYDGKTYKCVGIPADGCAEYIFRASFIKVSLLRNEMEILDAEFAASEITEKYQAWGLEMLKQFNINVCPSAVYTAAIKAGLRKATAINWANGWR